MGSPETGPERKPESGASMPKAPDGGGWRRMAAWRGSHPATPRAGYGRRRIIVEGSSETAKSNFSISSEAPVPPAFVATARR